MLVHEQLQLQELEYHQKLYSNVLNENVTNRECKSNIYKKETITSYLSSK